MKETISKIIDIDNKAKEIFNSANNKANDLELIVEREIEKENRVTELKAKQAIENKTKELNHKLEIEEQKIEKERKAKIENIMKNKETIIKQKANEIFKLIIN